MVNLTFGAVTPPPRKPCESECQTDYQPICVGPAGATNAREKKSFGNDCVLKNYNCQNNASE